MRDYISPNVTDGILCDKHAVFSFSWTLLHSLLDPSIGLYTVLWSVGRSISRSVDWSVGQLVSKTHVYVPCTRTRDNFSLLYMDPENENGLPDSSMCSSPRFFSSTPCLSVSRFHHACASASLYQSASLSSFLSFSIVR